MRVGGFQLAMESLHKKSYQNDLSQKNYLLQDIDAKQLNTGV